MNDPQARELRRLKWVLGVPYFAQGTTSLTEVPIFYFIKTTLRMGDTGGQLFDSLRTFGWFVKPLWGFISDRLPLAGYRRKSWFVLMAILALVFWTTSAVLSAAGIRLPWVYLLVFNLAFGTYAFVDVVCDALMVEHGQKLQRVAPSSLTSGRCWLQPMRGPCSWGASWSRKSNAASLPRG